MDKIKPGGEDMMTFRNQHNRADVDKAGEKALSEHEQSNEGVKLLQKFATCILSVRYNEETGDYRYDPEKQRELGPFSLSDATEEDAFHHFVNGVNGKPFFNEGKSLVQEIGEAGPGGTSVEFKKAAWKKTESESEKQYAVMVVNPQNSKWGPYAFVSSLDGKERLVLYKNAYEWRYIL